jgi:putative aldouronate transport system substrate-binding protein
MSEPMFWGGTFLAGMDGNDPTAAAKVIDYLSSEEGYKLTALGIAGRDYEETNGEITLLPARGEDGFPIAAGDTGAHPLASAIVSWVPSQWQEFSLLYGKDDAFKEWFAQMRQNQIQHQIPSVGLLTTSPLWTDFQSTSAELVTRSFLEIVQSGSENDAASRFDQFVDDWKGTGGADAQAEMSELLVGIYG